MKTKLFNITKITTLLTFSLMAIFLLSCEESENILPEEEFTDIIDESYTSEVFDELEDISDEATDYLDNLSTTKSTTTEYQWRYNRLSPCATITRVFEEDYVSIVIDFGEENCLCNDGRERRGIINIMHYGHYWSGDVEIGFSFDEFFVDDNQITGTKTVLRTINEAGNRQSDITIDGAIILADDAGTINWYAERTREVVVGSDTREKNDDVIEVTGFSNGTLADGTAISGEIITPLVRINEQDCFRFFVSGVRNITKGSEPVVSIDYGDGTCDNLAEVTKNGVTTTIELNRRRHIW